MPEPVNNTDGGSVGTETTSRASAFSPDYVKELREEAASWRTKFREMETKAQNLEQSIKVGEIVSNVTSEINKRGLKINPEFITIGEDGDAVSAVDKFLEEYPQFAVSPTQKDNQNVNRTKPITSNKLNTNAPVRKDKIMDLKNDPIGRAKLRDQYRSMLGRGEN